jgi:hypothetical protein
MFNVYSKICPKTRIRKQKKQSVSIISEQPSYNAESTESEVTANASLFYSCMIHVGLKKFSDEYLFANAIRQ